MILVWFNPNKESYYTRFYKTYILNDYFVGFVNSYNHIVVQIFIISDNHLYNVNNYYDYIKQRESQKQNNKHKKLLTFFKMLIYNTKTN